MTDKGKILEGRLTGLVREWTCSGLPGRDTLIKSGQDLQHWKRDSEIEGIFERRPRFLTATLDDAWGMGLDLIELYADVAGLDVVRLGLLKSAEEITQACHKEQPDFLGMTVLQLDSSDDLYRIGRHLPEKTKLVVGGPVFKADPDMADAANVHFVANSLLAFVKYLLSSAWGKMQPR